MGWLSSVEAKVEDKLMRKAMLQREVAQHELHAAAHVKSARRSSPVEPCAGRKSAHLFVAGGAGDAQSPSHRPR